MNNNTNANQKNLALRKLSIRTLTPSELRVVAGAGHTTTWSTGPRCRTQA
jgi:hypothetical protein